MARTWRKKYGDNIREWVAMHGAIPPTEASFVGVDWAEGEDSSTLAFLSFSGEGMPVESEVATFVRVYTEPLARALYSIGIGETELPGTYEVTTQRTPDGRCVVTIRPADEVTEWALQEMTEKRDSTEEGHEDGDETQDS